jgi:hypothetical protein
VDACNLKSDVSYSSNFHFFYFFASRPLAPADSGSREASDIMASVRLRRTSSVGPHSRRGSRRQSKARARLPFSQDPNAACVDEHSAGQEERGATVELTRDALVAHDLAQSRQSGRHRY